MFLIKVIQALEKYQVQYAIAGGLAVALHGAVRATIDLDIVIALNKKNFENAEKALLAIQLIPKLPVNASQVYNFREEYINNRNLIAWSFYNPQQGLEVVDIVITEDLKKLKTKKISIHGHKVVILALTSLIQMKKNAGRPQDLDDVKALEHILNESKNQWKHYKNLLLNTWKNVKN